MAAGAVETIVVSIATDVASIESTIDKIEELKNLIDAVKSSTSSIKGSGLRKAISDGIADYFDEMVGVVGETRKAPIFHLPQEVVSSVETIKDLTKRLEKQYNLGVGGFVSGSMPQMGLKRIMATYDMTAQEVLQKWFEQVEAIPEEKLRAAMLDVIGERAESAPVETLRAKMQEGIFKFFLDAITGRKGTEFTRNIGHILLRNPQGHSPMNLMEDPVMRRNFIKTAFDVPEKGLQEILKLRLQKAFGAGGVEVIREAFFLARGTGEIDWKKIQAEKKTRIDELEKESVKKQRKEQMDKILEILGIEEGKELPAAIPNLPRKLNKVQKKIRESEKARMVNIAGRMINLTELYKILYTDSGYLRGWARGLVGMILEPYKTGSAKKRFIDLLMTQIPLSILGEGDATQKAERVVEKFEQAGLLVYGGKEGDKARKEFKEMIAGLIDEAIKGKTGAIAIPSMEVKKEGTAAKIFQDFFKEEWLGQEVKIEIVSFVKKGIEEVVEEMKKEGKEGFIIHMPPEIVSAEVAKQTSEVFEFFAKNKELTGEIAERLSSNLADPRFTRKMEQILEVIREKTEEDSNKLTEIKRILDESPPDIDMTGPRE